MDLYLVLFKECAKNMRAGKRKYCIFLPHSCSTYSTENILYPAYASTAP